MLPNFPPLTGLVVNLEFTQPAEFNIFHEMSVDAFLRHLLNIGEIYSRHITIITPENGRLDYPAGTPYRFVVMMLGEQSETTPIWRKLITQLQALPDSAPIKDKGVPLKNNIKLIGLQDLFDGIPVSNEQSLDEYTIERAHEQAEAWAKAANIENEPVTLEWTWQSISRVLRQDHKHFKKDELRYCRDNQDLTGRLILQRLYDTLANLHTQFSAKPIAPTITTAHKEWLLEQAEFIEIIEPDQYWLDTPYYGKQGKQNTLGGLAGHFKLKLNPGIDSGILSLLILGEVIGIGQRRTSGFGKYRLHAPFQNQHYHLNLGLEPIKVTRAQPLTEALCQRQILEQA